MKNKILTILAFLAPLLTVFYFIYSSVLIVPYGFHEDFWFWAYDHHHERYINFDWNVKLGRPIMALLMDWFGHLIGRISDLRYLRGISFFCMVSSATLLALWLWKRLKFDKVAAFLLATCIFTLPAIQAMMSFSINLIEMIALLAALVGFLFVEKAQIDCTEFKTKILFFILGAVFILISCFMYQPSAMFPAALLCGYLLFSDQSEWRSRWRFIVRNIIIFVLILLAYFLITKFVLFPVCVSKDPHWIDHMPGQYKFQLATDLKGKMDFLIDQLNLKAFNLWRIIPWGENSSASGLVAVFVGGFILFCAVIKLICDLNKVRNGALNIRRIFLFYCGSIFLLGVLILLANAPNLVAVGGTAWYRGLIAYPAIVVLLLIWSLRQLVSLFKVRWREFLFIFFLSVLTLAGAFSSQRNVLQSGALSNYIELSFLRASLIPHIMADDITTICVIRPADFKNYVGLSYPFDEIGMPTTRVPDDLQNMVRAIYLQYGKDTRNKITVRDYDYREKYVVIKDAKKTLVIDMNDLLPDADTFPHPQVVEVTVSSDQHESVDGILNGTAVWHAQTPPKYPEWIKIAYKNPLAIDVLRMKPQPGATKRAPKDFILQASNDDKTWIDLLRVEGNMHKDGNDWHSWRLNNNKQYRYYRLYISKNGGDPNWLTIHQLKLEESAITSSSYMNNDPYLWADGILSGKTLWHARKPPQFPEWVEITYKNPMAASVLKMKPQPNNSPGDDMHKRAPRDFILQASNDDKMWIDLLHVKGNIHKDGNDWHEWRFGNKKLYHYYRLYITATSAPNGLTLHQLKLE